MYCGITEIPEAFRVGNGDLLTYSPTAAFWVFNQVSNWAYTRYSDMITVIRGKQADLEGQFIAFTPAVDQAAKSILQKNGETAARKFLTEYSGNQANGMTAEWKKLYEYLLVKFIDGNVKKEENGQFKRNPYGEPAMPDQPRYPDWWYRIIVDETGNHLKMP